MYTYYTSSTLLIFINVNTVNVVDFTTFVRRRAQPRSLPLLSRQAVHLSVNQIGKVHNYSGVVLFRRLATAATLLVPHFTPGPPWITSGTIRMGLRQDNKHPSVSTMRGRKIARKIRWLHFRPTVLEIFRVANNLHGKVNNTCDTAKKVGAG